MAADSASLVYVSTILEGGISTIDALQSEDEISALTIRLEYLNRVIVSEGLPDSLVSSIGEVLSILKRRETLKRGTAESPG